MIQNWLEKLVLQFDAFKEGEQEFLGYRGFNKF